jgi:hypothetical protein
LVWQALPTGALVGFAYAQSSAFATGSTTIPQDDTLPQSGEGNEYITCAITPKATTHLLEIEITVFLSSSATGAVMTAALFQDSGANALAAGSNFQDASSQFSTRPITFRYVMAAGTTSATTFKVRAGTHNAGTTTFNGVNGAGRYSTAIKSSITIREYKA